MTYVKTVIVCDENQGRQMKELTEPTNKELEGAHLSACLATAFGSNDEQVKRLRAMRNSRTTWLGWSDMFLRRELDSYLSEYPI